MKINKVLLVGGSGYIGEHLQNAMKTSFQIFTTTRKIISAPASFTIDLTQPQTFKSLAGHSFDLIIYLASEIKGLGNEGLDGEVLKPNLLGLISFLKYAQKEKLGDKIIYISSMTVYGIENELSVKETGQLKPLSTYGLSKLMAEQAFEFFCRTSGVKGVRLRIPGIYGGSRKAGFIYNTILKMKRNEAVILKTKGLGYWECMHIDDLCDSMIRFINAYQWSEPEDVFNLSYGVRTDFVECARMIKEFLKSDSKIEIEGEKGYKDLYLDNSRIKKVIPIQDNYLTSLKGYVNSGL